MSGIWVGRVYVGVMRKMMTFWLYNGLLGTKEMLSDESWLGWLSQMQELEGLSPAWDKLFWVSAEITFCVVSSANLPSKAAESGGEDEDAAEASALANLPGSALYVSIV